jgi:hypothetical protein
MSIDIWADPKPWMTEGLIQFVEQELRPDDIVLEFGGGASSIWWCSRAKYTYTVEASPDWAPTLIEKMAQYPHLLAKWSMLFVPCEWHTSYLQPKRYWKQNAKMIDEEQALHLNNIYSRIPQEVQPTVIIIDGSVRPQTVVTTSDYVKHSTQVRMIVVDNMESMRKSTEGMFTDFKEYPFHEKDPQKIPKHQKGKWCSSAFVRVDSKNSDQSLS